MEATPAYGLSSPAAERVRERALSAGWEILLNEGWDALSQRRVAEVAGVGRATVYRHWPDRTSMVQDIWTTAATRVHAMPTGDLRGDLCNELVSLYRELGEGGFDKVVLALTERCLWEPDLSAVKAAAVERGSMTIRQILAEAVERGDLPASLDVEEAVGFLLGPMIYRHMFADQFLAKETLERSVDDFLALRRRGSARSRRRPTSQSAEGTR